jgi:hypothetical protein
LNAGKLDAGRRLAGKGGRPVATKMDFTPDEWKTLLESVMMAGIAVTAADPRGLWGSLKESVANARAIMAAKHDPEATGLIRALAGEFETSEGRAAARDGLSSQLSGKRPSEIVAQSIKVIKEAAALVNAKAPEDADSFKSWLQHISEAVAAAAMEGGFLGFGGVRVSESEKATLAEISASLGLESP